jgi:uncharacterized membrane protein YesL
MTEAKYRRVRVYRVRGQWCKVGKTLFALCYVCAALTVFFPSLYPVFAFSLVAFLALIVQGYYVEELTKEEEDAND